MRRMFQIGLLATIFAALLAVSVMAGPHGQAWLGVYTQAVDKDLAGAFNLRTETGAIVNQVADDSPAAGAGLKEDDIIVAFDGRPVTSDKTLSDLVAAADPGQGVTVTILRGDDRKDIAVKLGDRSESEASSDLDSPGGRTYTRTFNFDNREYGYVGASLLDISQELAEHFGADKGGVLVNQVEDGSPAQKAGLMVGDVIVAVDGQSVDSPAEIQRRVRPLKEGEHTSFEIVRDHQSTSVDIQAAVRKGNAYGLAPGFQWFDQDFPQIPGLQRLFGDAGDPSDSDALQAMRDELKELRKELSDLKSNLNK